VRGTAVYTSTVAPVIVDGERRGYVVRWSRIGNQRPSSRAITDLMGSDAAIYLVNQGAGITIDASGRPVAFPARVARADTVFGYNWPGRGQFLAASAPLRGTQWTLVTEFPRTTVLARSVRLLRRFAVVALVLMVAGAGGAWLVSRGLTRPLAQLTEAAERVAAGDLSARVETGRADELGRLASTFNAMGSSLGEAQHRLEQARAAAETANAVKGDFLATMSHEIRTPLNAILGYTDLLQIGIAGPLTEQQQEYLGRTQASGKHLLALLSDILDLSKIEAGGMEVRRETARASVAVDSALALVLPQAAARGIEIVNECDDSASTRYVGDEGRVQQILANLLSNAVKFTNPAGA
jgi:signal transduction histidine kinase